jgi:hypothetical protein
MWSRHPTTEMFCFACDSTSEAKGANQPVNLIAQIPWKHTTVFRRKSHASAGKGREFAEPERNLHKKKKPLDRFLAWEYKARVLGNL